MAVYISTQSPFGGLEPTPFLAPLLGVIDIPSPLPHFAETDTLGGFVTVFHGERAPPPPTEGQSLNWWFFNSP